MNNLRPLRAPEVDAAAAYQLTLERRYLWSLPPFLLLVGVTFLAVPNIPLYIRFSHDLRILILPTFFFGLCVFGMALAPAVYIFRERLSVVWKRQLALLCLIGLALYTLTVGVYSLLTGTTTFGVVVYIAFLLPWVREVFAIYRE